MSAPLTFVQTLDGLHDGLTERMSQSPSSEAKREYALAKTALEDAMIRFTRAYAIDTGREPITDLEYRDHN